MATYSELLKDARWIERRKEIYARAGMRCQECGKTQTKLEVHHLYYERGRLPWEYPDSALRCLCSSCHETATYEARLKATTQNEEVRTQIEYKQQSQTFMHLLGERLAMPSFKPPKPKKPLTAPQVWDKIKVLGEAKSRPMMACLVKLCRKGFSDAMLLQIATHYSEHHATIQNPFAYYSQGGKVLEECSAQVSMAEGEKFKREESIFSGADERYFEALKNQTPPAQPGDVGEQSTLQEKA